jgi:hypothetical protein
VTDSKKEPTLADLDARLRAVEALQSVILRILSTTKPLDGVLEQYGATEAQQRAFYRLLDDLAARAKGHEKDRPSFPHFEMKIAEILPARRGDREFMNLVIDTLKVERLVYRELHEYILAQGWRSPR